MTIQQIFHNWVAKGEMDRNSFREPVPPVQVTALEKELGLVLPATYKEFLRFTNGYEGPIGQEYVSLIGAGQIQEATRQYCTPFFPWAICIGSDGGQEMLVIDTSTQPFRFGVLPFVGEELDFIPLGTTFPELLGHFMEEKV